MNQSTLELIELSGAVPLLVDGSDGSLWASRASLADAVAQPELAGRLLVRVSDFIKAVELLENNLLAKSYLTPMVSSVTVVP